MYNKPLACMALADPSQQKICPLNFLFLKKWLGRQDSNLRIPGSKPGALPLGDGPTITEHNMFSILIVTYQVVNLVIEPA